MNIAMKHFIILLAMTWLGTNSLHAQQYRGAHAGPRTYDISPTVSPYLKLAPVINQNNELQYIDGAYQNFVRPQIQQRQTIQKQQLQLTKLRTQLDRVRLEASVAGQPLQTGHQSRFQSYSHYYPEMSAQKR